MTIDDYSQAETLWRDTPGIGLSDADSRGNIEFFLNRNPGMSFSAFEGDRLIGTIMSGHDGRRGYIYHLAVHEDYRRRGIGGMLIKESLRKLELVGIGKCHLFVFGENEDGKGFWRRQGWMLRDDIAVFSMNL
jgi:N-acetylglutamate synthase